MGQRKDHPLHSAPSSAPVPRRRLAWRALASVAPIATAAAAIAGCGSTAAVGTSANPAVAIPASAALYAGAAVRPGGTLGTEALAAGKLLTHQADPYLRLLVALQTPGAPTLEYKRDVAPWLGPNAGVYVTSPSAVGPLSALLEQGLLGGGAAGAFPFGAGGVQGAIVLDTSDVGKAETFLNSEAQHAGAHQVGYRGVKYKLSGGGVAFGIVDRFAVIGSEAGMHGVIDTTLGSPSLARAGGYAKLMAAAPANALAHLYSQAAGAQPAANTGSQAGLAGVMGLLAGGAQANISLVASAGSLALDADTLASRLERRRGRHPVGRPRQRQGAGRAARRIVACGRAGAPEHGALQRRAGALGADRPAGWRWATGAVELAERDVAAARNPGATEGPRREHAPGQAGVHQLDGLGRPVRQRR